MQRSTTQHDTQYTTNGRGVEEVKMCSSLQKGSKRILIDSGEALLGLEPFLENLEKTLKEENYVM